MTLKWESIDAQTERLRVPGGWIVRTSVFTYFGVAVHQIFIADNEHIWELS